MTRIVPGSPAVPAAGVTGARPSDGPRRNAQTVDRLLRTAAQAAQQEVGVALTPYVFGDVRYLHQLDPSLQNDVDVVLTFDDGEDGFQGFEQALSASVYEAFLRALQSAATAEGLPLAMALLPESPRLSVPDRSGTLRSVAVELSLVPASQARAWGVFSTDWHLARFLRGVGPRERVSGLLAAADYLGAEVVRVTALRDEFFQLSRQRVPDWLAFLGRWSSLGDSLQQKLEALSPAEKASWMKERLAEPL